MARGASVSLFYLSARPSVSSPLPYQTGYQNVIQSERHDQHCQRTAPVQHWHLTLGDRTKSTGGDERARCSQASECFDLGRAEILLSQTHTDRARHRGYAASLFSTPRLEPDFTRSHTLSAGAAACQDWRCLSNQAEQAAEIDTDLHAPSNSQYCWV